MTSIGVWFSVLAGMGFAVPGDDRPGRVGGEAEISLRAVTTEQGVFLLADTSAGLQTSLSDPSDPGSFTTRCGGETRRVLPVRNLRPNQGAWRRGRA